MVLSLGYASGEDGNRVQYSCNRLNWGALDALYTHQSVVVWSIWTVCGYKNGQLILL